jgi:hypothetical protein
MEMLEDRAVPAIIGVPRVIDGDLILRFDGGADDVAITQVAPGRFNVTTAAEGDLGDFFVSDDFKINLGNGFNRLTIGDDDTITGLPDELYVTGGANVDWVRLIQLNVDDNVGITLLGSNDILQFEGSHFDDDVEVSMGAGNDCVNFLRSPNDARRNFFDDDVTIFLNSGNDRVHAVDNGASFAEEFNLHGGPGTDEFFRGLGIFIDEFNRTSITQVKGTLAVDDIDPDCLPIVQDDF